MSELLGFLRSAVPLFLVSVLLVHSLGPTQANATLPLSAYFGPICIGVSDLAEDLRFETRDDLAERVSAAVQVKVEAVEKPSRHGGRVVRAAPNCIKAGQSEFDLQLTLNLSVKRQKIKLDGRDWSVVVVGGVSTNSLIQDGWVQPVIIVQPEGVSDDSAVAALVEFVDRTVVAALRQR